MRIDSAYNIGDSVYGSDYETVEVRQLCPDCLGSGTWTITTPAGESVVIDCPTCSRGWESSGFVSVSEIRPVVRSLTIGRVTFEPDYSKDDNPLGFRYMCEETGVGTGTVYSESALFSDQDMALEAAKVKAAEVKKNIDAEAERRRVRALKEAGRRLRAKPCEACGGTGKQQKKSAVA